MLITKITNSIQSLELWHLFCVFDSDHYIHFWKNGFRNCHVSYFIPCWCKTASQGPYINKEGMAFFALYMRRVKCTYVCTICMCVYEQWTATTLVPPTPNLAWRTLSVSRRFRGGGGQPSRLHGWTAGRRFCTELVIKARNAWYQNLLN